MKKLLVLILAMSMMLSLCACHRHSWIEATCTEPKTCSECGKTEGEALGHDAEAWSVTKAATLLSEGEESRICTRCGESLESRSLPMKTTACENGVFHFTPEDYAEYLLSRIRISLEISKCDDELAKVGTHAYSVVQGSRQLAVLSFQENASGEIESVVFQTDSMDGLIIAIYAFNVMCDKDANTDSQEMFFSLTGEFEYSNYGKKMTVDIVDHSMILSIAGV